MSVIRALHLTILIQNVLLLLLKFLITNKKKIVKKLPNTAQLSPTLAKWRWGPSTWATQATAPDIATDIVFRFRGSPFLGIASCDKSSSKPKKAFWRASWISRFSFWPVWKINHRVNQTLLEILFISNTWSKWNKS